MPGTDELPVAMASESAAEGPAAVQPNVCLWLGGCLCAAPCHDSFLHEQWQSMLHALHCNMFHYCCRLDTSIQVAACNCTVLHPDKDYMRSPSQAASWTPSW